jgi:hypothetical protein
MGKKGGGNTKGPNLNRGENSLRKANTNSDDDCSVDETEDDVTITITTTQLEKLITDVVKNELKLLGKDIADRFFSLEQEIANQFKMTQQKLTDTNTLINTLHDTSEKLKNDLSGILKTLQNSRSTTKQSNEHVPSAPQTSVVEALTEMQDQEAKKNNFLLLNIPESCENDIKKRVDDDMKKFKVFTEVLDVNEDTNDIKLFRIGKPSAERPRPIVVKGSLALKAELFRNIKKMKDLPTDHDYIKVVLRHDLTKKQQEAEKILVSEMRQRRAKGESVYIYKGKIHVSDGNRSQNQQ